MTDTDSGPPAVAGPQSSVARARDLIIAAAAMDRPAFGRAYQAIIDPELDTDAVIAMFGYVRAAYGDFADAEPGEGLTGALDGLDEDPDADALDRIHRLSTAAYPVCSELLEINLAVLEHVFRSVLGRSDFLANTDGYHVALQLAVLAGGLRWAAAESATDLPSAAAVLAEAVP
ncbi:MAG: hypothetical protein JWN95_3022 [Frankiales bacterium]|nr:hypothetical protein [Frankiales bacterium]